MDNGEWTMDNGQWTMDNGQWTMDNGQFSRVNLRIFANSYFEDKPDCRLQTPDCRLYSTVTDLARFRGLSTS